MKIAIMLSGSGTTYAALANAEKQGLLNGKIVRVVASKPTAGGIARAEGFGHPVTIVNPRDENHHLEIAEIFRADGVQLVVMAGWMHLWKLPDDFQGKTVNTHPALIPAFCGKGMYGEKVHKAVIEFGARVTGCTVHLVDGEYDHGRILEQRAVPVELTDTPESVAAKVQSIEKALLVSVVANWSQYKSC